MKASQQAAPPFGAKTSPSAEMPCPLFPRLREIRCGRYRWETVLTIPVVG